ncbi:MAG: PAS domain-containing protein [Alphaproteobacteria bacterium]|nr:PAS domain-containing protein [Alphaproteobacteria bacterium]
MANRFMEDMKAHPYTKAVLDAWRRLAEGAAGVDGPMADDYPGLIGNLFVLNHVGEGDYCFRRVGSDVERLFGRQLGEHNFLSLWSEPDRSLLAAALKSAALNRGPARVRASGETLDGRRMDMEFALAPLSGHLDNTTRFLGLCQGISPIRALGGRPLRRLSVSAIYPPPPEPRRAAIRLVSSR